MSDVPSLEQRVGALEKEVAGLKRRVGEGEAQKSWIERITGSFADDPDFEEILRLGREIRRADRPDDAVPG